MLGEKHPDYADCLCNLSELYYAMADYDRAVPLFKQALAITRESIEDSSLVQSERQQLAMAQNMRHQLDSFVSLAFCAKRFEEEAFREVLAWKGATLVRQRQMRKVADDVKIAPLFAKLQQTVTRLATLVRAVPEPKKQEVWRRQIADLSAEKERLEAELSRQSAAFRQTKKRITLEDLMAALPRDAVLVDVLSAQIDTPSKKDGKPSKTTRQRRLIAFVVQHDKPVALVDLGAVSPLSEAIDTWRVTFGMSPDGAVAGQLLRKRIAFGQAALSS